MCRLRFYDTAIVVIYDHLVRGRIKPTCSFWRRAASIGKLSALPGVTIYQSFQANIARVCRSYFRYFSYVATIFGIEFCSSSLVWQVGRYHNVALVFAEAEELILIHIGSYMPHLL